MLKQTRLSGKDDRLGLGKDGAETLSSRGNLSSVEFCGGSELVKVWQDLRKRLDI